MINIGCDIDGVLALFNKGFLSYINKKINVNIKEEQIIGYNFYETLGLSKNEVSELFTGFVSSQGFLNLDKDEKVIGVLKKIIKKHRKDINIQFVTARSSDLIKHDVHNYYFAINKLRAKIRRETKDWLKNNGLNAKVVFRKDKGLYCMQNKIDVLLEDCLENAINISKTGTKVFLLDRPWNRNDKNKNSKYVRIYNNKQLEEGLINLIKSREEKK